MNDSIRLVVSIKNQLMSVFMGETVICNYPVSTAINGVGFDKGSFKTPIGKFRICEKIGHNAAAGTIFKSRVACGRWKCGDDFVDDLILTRILRLEGMDNENANTFDRCIYIHGTNCEDLLGQPAGHGCIRLGNLEIIELFKIVSEGVEIEIVMV